MHKNGTKYWANEIQLIYFLQKIILETNILCNLLTISKSGLSIYLINDSPIQEIYVMVAKTRRIKKSYGNRKLVLPPAHAQPSASVWWFTDHTPPHLQALDDSQHHLPLPLLGSFNSSYPTISNTFPRLIPLVKEVIAYLYNSTYNKCLCIISLFKSSVT